MRPPAFSYLRQRLTSFSSGLAVLTFQLLQTYLTTTSIAIRT